MIPNEALWRGLIGLGREELELRGRIGKLDVRIDRVQDHMDRVLRIVEAVFPDPEADDDDGIPDDVLERVLAEERARKKTGNEDEAEALAREVCRDWVVPSTGGSISLRSIDEAEAADDTALLDALLDAPLDAGSLAQDYADVVELARKQRTQNEHLERVNASLYGRLCYAKDRVKVLEGPSHTPEEWARIEAAKAKPEAAGVEIQGTEAPLGSPYIPESMGGCLECTHYHLDDDEEPCVGCVRVCEHRSDRFEPADPAKEGASNG